jgi:hypothetical protein
MPGSKCLAFFKIKNNYEKNFTDGSAGLLTFSLDPRKN